MQNEICRTIIIGIQSITVKRNNNPKLGAFYAQIPNIRKILAEKWGFGAFCNPHFTFWIKRACVSFIDKSYDFCLIKVIN